MEPLYLTCRSLTYAQRVSRALAAAGVQNTIIRTPQNMSREGCGYAVRIQGRALSRAMSVLAAAKLPPRRVYRPAAGGYEEVTV